MTGAGKDLHTVKKLVALIALGLMLAVPVAGAMPKPKPVHVKTPGFPPLPKGWSHADVNVTIDGQSHTLELDRGVVTRVTPTDLRMRERDDTVADVSITRSTVVVLVGKKNKPNDGIAVGMVAWTLRVDGGPAVRVRAGWGI
jgi:hypothetical protein